MNAPTLTVAARGSHLYPGATGTLSGHGTGDCLVEFADGSVALGTIEDSGADTVLALGPYTTAAGTEIRAKRWTVVVAGPALRILARVP